MSNAPETKYTDRDVRESGDLVDRAIAYVENYTGDFQYLIDMKMRLAQEDDLTTPMIRGILNCMRHDPRIRNMPSPLPPDEATVTPIRSVRRQTGKRKRYGGTKPCNDQGVEHGYHNWTDEDEWCEYACTGWHLINRVKPDDHGYLTTHLFMDATVKRPFAAARGGMLVHLVQSASCRWYIEPHAWGFAHDPELVVKTACRYPSFLDRPVLMDEEQAAAQIERKYCPHCAEVMR